jgi:NADH:ubiquinone oxidoreductase subunit E
MEYNMTSALKRKTSNILKNRNHPHELIEVMQDIQDTFNYLPEEALKIIAEEIQIPLIEVFRVANFYKAFSLTPRGKHLLTVCMGTACHVRGASKFRDEVIGLLKIQPGETTPDGEITVEEVNCLGACALGPVVVLDGEYHGHMTPGKLRKLINKTIGKTRSK